MLQLLSVIGSFCLVMGYMLLAYKFRPGWVISGFGSFIFIYVNIMREYPAEVIVSALFVFINMVGFIQWGKKEVKNESGGV